MLFFVIEWALRPLLIDLSAHLPGDAELHPNGVSLRTRLLTALLAINIVTGVFVAALARPEGADLNDLGIVVLVSFGVTLTGAPCGSQSEPACSSAGWKGQVMTAGAYTEQGVWAISRLTSSAAGARH